MAQNWKEREKRKKVKEMVASNTPPIILDHSPHPYLALTKPLQLTRQNIIFCGGRRSNTPPNLDGYFLCAIHSFFKKKFYILKYQIIPSTG
jgi:hypothetical protein